TMIVTYVEPKTVAPPQITLSTVQPLPDGEVRNVEAGRQLIVDSPRIRLAGEVKAEEPLVRCVLVRGEDAGLALTKFAAGRSREWTLGEEGDRQRGRQTIGIVAKTGTSKESESAVTIVYQPALPKVELLEPLPGRVLYEGEDQPVLELKARLRPARDPRP